MRRFSVCLGGLAACGLLVFAGCGDGKTEEEKTGAKSPPVVAPKTTDDGGKTKAFQPPKPKAEIAKVVLTAEEQATCVVKPNDPFPDAKLNDLAGAPRALSQLRGEQATVVLVWTNQNRVGKGALKSMSARASQELPGVRYVGICAGDDSEEAKQAADKAATPFPVLIDKELSFFKQIIRTPNGQQPTDVLPRVYLLDSTGKILWMSLAFQPADERELELALQFVLKPSKGAE